MFGNERSFSKRFPMALILSVLFGMVISGAHAASGGTPYDRGMKAFASGDFKNSDALFCQTMKADPSNANAMYMDALSLQRLGGGAKANVLYKTILVRFPDSGAAVRAQQALDQSDPIFAQRWKIDHPPKKQFGIGHLQGPGLSPDFSYGTVPLTTAQQKKQTDMVLSHRPVKCKINGIWTEIQLDSKQPLSFLGDDFLSENGLTTFEKGKIIQTEINIDQVRLTQFEFHKVARTTYPIKVGRDFQEAYVRQIAMANPITGQRYLAARSVKRNGKPGSAGDSKLNTALDEPKAGEEYFDVHYSSDNDGRKIIPVQVNGTNIDMIYGETSGMLMGPDQVRQIDQSLLSDSLKSEVVGGNAIRNSGTVVFRSVAVGKVVKYQVPCRVEAYTGLRGGMDSSPRQYPLLGSDFFSAWLVRVDEDRKILRVSRQIPGYQASPNSQSNQQQGQQNNQTPGPNTQ